LDEEEIKKKMEEMGIDVNELTEGDDNEEGMTAPKGLDEQVRVSIPIGFIQKHFSV
jgi:hypothetical protein